LQDLHGFIKASPDTTQVALGPGLLPRLGNKLGKLGFPLPPDLIVATGLSRRYPVFLQEANKNRGMIRDRGYNLFNNSLTEHITPISRGHNPI
jgi:hypothetical protein